MDNDKPLQDLQHIKNMMERSSRFISLSGFSGIAAGICAIIGAYFAFTVIGIGNHAEGYIAVNENPIATIKEFMGYSLFRIALLTLIGAIIFAFVFTYLRSKKNNVPMWGSASKRLILAIAIPLIAGGFYLLRQIQMGHYGLIAPGTLIFYGLALLNGSKYTLGEIKYLGYAQIALGIISSWMIGYGLYFWTFGFGVLHIVYGAIMWYKYERI